MRPCLSAALLLLSACKTEYLAPATFTDDFGDAITVGIPPKRIVSLNPATTDLMFALGAGKKLVGRTHWDSYPDSALLVPDLGPGLRPNVEAVLGAHPDLVLLYASNDNRTAAAEIRAAGVKTLSLKIDHIDDFYRASRLIGRLIGDSVSGANVADSVKRTLDRVRKLTSNMNKPRVFWHIWDAPLITIGQGSYMNELVEIAGAENIYADIKEPSPTVSIEDVLKRDPDFIITGPEGAEKIGNDPKWAESRAVKKKGVLAADTALVGRPSVRLGEAAVSLAKLFHPGRLR
ncbi:MAG TPA: helical backbone metal receptor [Gemmatimonadaceae bacterium]|nr:helical backbone metal receptor [Gemmatimonadaceae bacterium]